MREALGLVTVTCAVGCGLVAGFFFAFSRCVMDALAKLPPAQGMAAMQSINVVVINPWVMTALFGTAAACVLAAIGSFAQWHMAGARGLLAGSVLYLVGVVLVTGLFNVPRNDALAAASVDSPEGHRLWAAYLSGWTAWNHVRTLTALAASVAFAIAYRLRA